MASAYKRLADAQTGAASKTQEREQWLDLGAFRELDVQLRMLSAGSAGNIKLQHAAVPEEGAFADISGLSWSASGSGGFAQSTAFLRYVRWTCDGSVAGNPVFTIDIMAKE